MTIESQSDISLYSEDSYDEQQHIDKLRLLFVYGVYYLQTYIMLIVKPMRSGIGPYPVRLGVLLVVWILIIFISTDVSHG